MENINQTTESNQLQVEEIEEQAIVSEDTPSVERKVNQKVKQPNWLVKWLRYKNRTWRVCILVLLIIFSILATLVAGYFCLLNWLPSLWSWGF